MWRRFPKFATAYFTAPPGVSTLPQVPYSFLSTSLPPRNALAMMDRLCGCPTTIIFAFIIRTILVYNLRPPWCRSRNATRHGLSVMRYVIPFQVCECPSAAVPCCGGASPASLCSHCRSTVANTFSGSLISLSLLAFSPCKPQKVLLF